MKYIFVALIVLFLLSSCDDSSSKATIKECPNVAGIDCQPIVNPENQKYCEWSNREWIMKHCDISYTD